MKKPFQNRRVHRNVAFLHIQSHNEIEDQRADERKLFLGCAGYYEEQVDDGNGARQIRLHSGSYRGYKLVSSTIRKDKGGEILALGFVGSREEILAKTALIIPRSRTTYTG